MERAEWQNAFKLGKRRCTAKSVSTAQQKRVADDFRLLLDPIAFQWQAWADRIVITAERVPHQHKPVPAALLGLPDMRHFMDE